MARDPSAELIYLFRHQVLRDGLYQLLLPSERTRLHLLALESYGPADGNLRTARELAMHAQLALADGHGLDAGQVREVQAEQVRHLHRWAELAGAAWQNEEEALAWRSVSLHPLCSAAESAQARLKAAQALMNAGRVRECMADLQACRIALETIPTGRLHALERVATARGLSTGGDGPAASIVAQEAVAIAENLGEPLLVAEALECLGGLAERQGRLDEALGLQQRAFVLARNTGGAQALANLHNGYASVLREVGRMDEAMVVAKDALEAARKSNNPRLIAGALIGLGISLRAQGRYAEAEAHYLEGIELCSQCGLRRGHTVCLGNLANLVASHYGDNARAEPMLARVVVANREDGAVNSEAIAWNNLASIWLNMGLLAAARCGFETAMKLAARIPYPLLESRAACNVAQCLALLGRPQEARKAADRGLACLEGRDQGKFRLEFGEMCDLQTRLAQPDCADHADLAAAALARMKKLAGETGMARDAFANSAIERVEAVELECRNARAEGRAPLLVGGRLPQSLTPDQCAALADMPGVLDDAVRCALTERAAGQPAPPWHDETRAKL